DGWTRRVVVPDLVVRFLEVPPVLAGAVVEGHDRSGKQVVARADRAVVVRTRVACAEVDHPQVGVDRRGLPDGGAAVQIGVALYRIRVVRGRPGVAADVARGWNRVKAPNFFAGPGIQRVDPPTYAVFRARHTSEDHAVVVAGRTGDAVAV